LIGEPLRNAKQNRKQAILVNTATKDGIAGKIPILFNTVLNAAIVAIVVAVIKIRIP
jgi:Na+-translocating ferredoxin:NAD+ oxidoreductase RnfG subunit